MVARIWGQTRSYGYIYHWFLAVCTVVSLSAVSVFFRGGVSRGAGDKVAANISQPGGAKLSDQRANAPRLCASGNFGSGYAGLRNMRASGQRGSSCQRLSVSKRRDFLWYLGVTCQKVAPPPGKFLETGQFLRKPRVLSQNKQSAAHGCGLANGGLSPRPIPWRPFS